MKKQNLKRAYFDWLGGITEKTTNELTKEQFVRWWEENGKFHLRGTGLDDLCMARKDLTKPFSIDNIELITHRERYRTLEARRGK